TALAPGRRRQSSPRTLLLKNRAARSGGRAAEPARGATRAEVLLLGGDGVGGSLERSCRLRPRQEVDVDTTDEAGAELDVARAETAVSGGLLAAAQRCDQRFGHDARCSLGEDACLRHSDRRNVPDRVHARNARLPRAPAARPIAVLGPSVVDWPHRGV